MAPRVFAILTPLAFALAACMADDPIIIGPQNPPAPPPAPEDPSTTYHGAARAILERHCTSCHVDGGAGPFPLTDFRSAVLYSFQLLPVIEAGLMPPWLPSADCRTYRDERRMTAEEIATLRTWVEAGTPEGDPATYVPAPAQGSPLDTIGPPDLTLGSPEPYTPSSVNEDDYRCFPLEHEFTEETYLILSDVTPQHKEIVHHVIIHLIQPAFVAQLDAADAREAGPGYTCFGGPGAGPPQNIGAWVPGSRPSPADEGTAIRIPAGSRLVMQVHYNTVFADPVPDQTTVSLWFSRERPQYLLRVQALPHLGIQIAAGDANSLQTREFRNISNETWTAVATAAHMHLLGTAINLTAVHQDGSEECVFDIPRWDFHWQQAYGFLPGQTISIAPGEKLRLNCWYDNSAAHQPMIDGVQQAPADVRWGEGTLEEMCLAYVMLIEPYSELPAPNTACPNFQSCYDQCAAGTTPKSACALQCAQPDGQACTQCVLPGIVQCVSDECATETGDMLECLEMCQGDPNPRSCARMQCVTQLLEFDRCAAPQIDDGTCDMFVAACNADL